MLQRAYTEAQGLVEVNPSWTFLVPISLCHVLGLCHSFKGCALPPSCLTFTLRKNLKWFSLASRIKSQILNTGYKCLSASSHTVYPMALIVPLFGPSVLMVLFLASGICPCSSMCWKYTFLFLPSSTSGNSSSSFRSQVNCPCSEKTS